MIIDNLSVHHSAVRNSLMELRYRIGFLPPYCPEFNPIEMWFHEVKTEFGKIRPFATTNKQVVNRVREIIERYIDHDFSEYFRKTKENLLGRLRGDFQNPNEVSINEE